MSEESLNEKYENLTGRTLLSSKGEKTGGNISSIIFHLIFFYRVLRLNFFQMKRKRNPRELAA